MSYNSGLTDAQLRATALPVSGTVGISGTVTTTISGAVSVTGTFWQATQPVSGTVGVSGSVAVTGPVTDAQIRATALPVSGTVTANAGSGTFAVSAASLPLPTGAATETTLAALNTKVTAVNTGAVTISSALPAGNNNIGDVDVVTLPVAFNSGATSATTQRVVLATDVALPTGANVIGGITQSGTWNIGTVTTLPALPANQSVNAAQINGVTPLTGNGVTGTGSLRVTVASDNTAFSVNAAQSGTWTVQPGNTANTTPWLFRPGDGTNSAAIKAASTAAATADAALVVSFAGANSATKIGDGTNNAAVKAASTAAAFTDPALAVDPRPGGAMLTASAALADGLANPTLGQQAVLNSLFNGSTWDRQRGLGFNTTTGDTGAKTTTGNGATQTNIGNKGVQILIAITPVSGTSPTFVGKLQGSVDGGTTFYDIPGATTASLTAAGNWGIMVYPGIAVTAGTTTSGTTATANMSLPRTWRLVWTIGGTTPSFTLTSVQYNYLVN